MQASPGWRLYHDWPRRLQLAQQAAAAVEFMHSHNVVHRDLTSNNLLVTDKWEAKVRVCCCCWVHVTPFIMTFFIMTSHVVQHPSNMESCLFTAVVVLDASVETSVGFQAYFPHACAFIACLLPAVWRKV